LTKSILPHINQCNADSLAANSAALVVSNLNYTIGSNAIISDFSVVIEGKQNIALVGLNGAGKSSLIQLLVAELSADSGDIQWCSTQLGYQACNMQALNQLTACEYLAFCSGLKDIPAKVVQIEIAKVSKQWQLGAILNKPMQALSQGNLQKLAIAQAFLQQPEVVLLDEPTQALDPVAQQLFNDNLNAIKGKTLCLFSSHHISEIVEAADQVLMMDQGKLIARLDLKAQQQLWFTCDTLIRLDKLDDKFEMKHEQEYSLGSDTNIAQMLELHYQNKAYLYSLNSNSLQQNQDYLTALSQHFSTETLGVAKAALLPLFSQLANQRL
jgi:ABC-2 type transport system ATP-binding protein